MVPEQDDAIMVPEQDMGQEQDDAMVPEQDMVQEQTMPWCQDTITRCLFGHGSKNLYEYNVQL